MAAHMFAKYHASAFNALTPVQNVMLPEDAWRLLTDEVVDVARERRQGVADLVSRGMVSDAGDLGTHVVEWQEHGDQEAATVSMDGRNRGAFDQASYTLKGAPVPIIHKDFDFDLRKILAARRSGRALDVTEGQLAAQVVAEAEEDMLFNGFSGIQWGGWTIYGYTTVVGRTPEATAKDFGTVTNIHEKFELMLAAGFAANHYGPWLFYVSLTQYNQMLAIIADTGGKTALQLIKEMEGVEDVKFSQRLTDEVIGVEMNRVVVDLAIAEDIRTVQWENPGGFSTGMRVMSAKVPRIKQPAGIIHGTSI